MEESKAGERGESADQDEPSLGAQHPNDGFRFQVAALHQLLERRRHHKPEP